MDSQPSHGHPVQLDAHFVEKRQTVVFRLSTLGNDFESLHSFTGPQKTQDEIDARNWPKGKKWGVVVTVATMTFLTTLASAMLAPAVPEIMYEFQSYSDITATFIISIYILGNAAGPMIIAPLSELYGRSYLYHSTNILFIIFTIACAVSTNMSMLIAFRAFQGMAGSTAMTIGGGTVSDLFVQEERGAAIAVWAMCPLLGAVVGPIIGAFVASAIGWRWVFWILTMAAGVVAIAFFIWAHETYLPTLLKRQGIRDSRSQVGSPKAVFLNAISRPFMMFFTSPIIALLAVLCALVYGYQYLIFTSITIIFEQLYGFSTHLIGLAFLGIGLGMYIGTAIFGIVSDKRIKKLKLANPTKAPAPEHRLEIMIPGGIFVPAGLFLYGWTAQYHVHWFVPLLGTFFTGAGIMAFFIPIQAYLVDAYPDHSASALAANIVLRSITGALIPLAGFPMITKLGIGWAHSVLGFIALILTPSAIFLVKYGSRLRSRDGSAVSG